MAKKLKWNLILMSVLYLGLGIFLLMRPSTALNVVCYALGGVVLVCAAVQLVRYFAVERGIFQSQLTLISGIICLGLGVSDPPQRHRGAHPAHRVRPVRHLRQSGPHPERSGPAPL